MMRLRDIKKKLSEDLVDGKIILKETTNFSGYGHLIENSKSVFGALELLSDQSWNATDFSPIEEMIVKHNARVNKSVTLDQNEYSQLNSYVNTINQQLPFFLGVIDSLVEDQNPQDINILLSNSIKTPQDLKTLVAQIEELSKSSNIDGGGVSFAGFDKGSDWIVITALGSGTYALIMSGLKLAQEYFKTKKEYYNSKDAELNYKTHLAQSSKKDEKFTQEGFEDFQKKRLEIQLEDGIDDIAVKMKRYNGFEENEIRTRLKKTTDSLIEIINGSNEIHISMNPPKEVTETASGQINIDYSFIEGKEEEVKHIEVGDSELEGTDD